MNVTQYGLEVRIHITIMLVFENNNPVSQLSQDTGSKKEKYGCQISYTQLRY